MTPYGILMNVNRLQGVISFDLTFVFYFLCINTLVLNFNVKKIIVKTKGQKSMLFLKCILIKREYK